MPDDKTEAYELKRINATPTKNSGRGKFNKGDGILSIKDEPIFTCDVKEYKKSFAVSEENWAKISLDAQKNGNTRPLFKLALGDTEPRTRVVVIDEDMFNMLIEAYWIMEDLNE